MQDSNSIYSRHSETKPKNLAVNPKDYKPDLSRMGTQVVAKDAQEDEACASVIGKNTLDLVYFAE